jgi:hypothetical protein
METWPGKIFRNEGPAEAGGGPWNCDQCTFTNAAISTKCEICEETRPVDVWVEVGVGLALLTFDDAHNAMLRLVHDEDELQCNIINSDVGACQASVQARFWEH